MFRMSLYVGSKAAKESLSTLSMSNEDVLRNCPFRMPDTQKHRINTCAWPVA